MSRQPPARHPTAPDKAAQPVHLVSPNSHGVGYRKGEPVCNRAFGGTVGPKRANLSRATRRPQGTAMAEPQSSSQLKADAERGLRTLRQACYREIPGSAMCVQNFDDSRSLAIRITYRISLRSSSLWEPRLPLLKVVKHFHS